MNNAPFTHSTGEAMAAAAGLIESAGGNADVMASKPLPQTEPASSNEMANIDRYWRAANYLTVGQIYLLANPLLREPLTADHIKPRLLGHWGTSPGLNFIWAHLNRIIRQRDADILFVCGPGHGGPALVANSWLEGSWSETYPEVGDDEAGVARLFRQFSFPGGIPSHAGPHLPGSIHEGGELGYSLSHAFGAVLDKPDLVVACVVGDGEAETGPLAAAWHGTSFIDPVHDGAVLPILHLNGYKIANPTILGRMPDEQLTAFFTGLGYEPLIVSGDVPSSMHVDMARALDQAFDRIATIRSQARAEGLATIPRWPMLILRSPKGWTGPKSVNGQRVEGFWRSHQVPIPDPRGHPDQLEQLATWMRSYRPEELFDDKGQLLPSLRALAPVGGRRMSANPVANAGRAFLRKPDWRTFALGVPAPGAITAEAPRALGRYLAELIRLDQESRVFRLVGPDETASNRLGDVFAATDRVWAQPIQPYDEHLARSGRVMEILSEHCCQGWLEGYLLTGGHGLFSCYEAFAPIVDSMVNQHAKWLKMAHELEWRRPISSLNYLLTSHVWRQDHNGFSHQDPGFIDHLASKKSDVARIYLPPDANCLLRVMDHCLSTYDRINAVVIGKQPAPQWLTEDEAEEHCAAGMGIWNWASNDEDGTEPEVVLACAGDVPTLEALAAVDLLRQWLPDLRFRFVNVVDLLALQDPDDHPHGLEVHAFEALFTRDRPVVFAFHGFPHLIHRLLHNRGNAANFHVHGFQDEGSTTTPFDMAVRNCIDRFHLAIAAIDHAGRGPQAAHARQHFAAALDYHRIYVAEHGTDLPYVAEWRWPS
jgi:xylulose-5-phosphate/fructose-6-phosphate phosphoketolase